MLSTILYMCAHYSHFKKCKKKSQLLPRGARVRIASVILITQKETKCPPEDSKHLYSRLVLGRGNGKQHSSMNKSWEHSMKRTAQWSTPHEHITEIKVQGSTIHQNMFTGVHREGRIPIFKRQTLYIYLLA